MRAGVDMADANPGLQFDRAEFEGNAASTATCASCNTTLADRYYEVGGAVACDACKRKIEADWSPGSDDFGARVGRFFRAALFGSLAALAGCAVYFGVLAVTGYEVGLISIFVGMIV